MGFLVAASKRRWQFLFAFVIAKAVVVATGQHCHCQSTPRESPGSEFPSSVDDPIQVESGLIESEAIDAPAPDSLTIADVLASVYRSFPEINRARQELSRADGQRVGAYGAYDTKLKALSLSEPTGFFRNYRHGIAAARQTWWGGNLAARYRIGRGVFQPWYRERETEKGGEFSLGWIQPLQQGRAIDPERFAVFQASLARRAADPILQEAILDTSKQAVLAYWDWVAAGATLQARRDLLALAETRGRQYQAGFQAGKFAEIDVILNNQLIAERKASVIVSQRAFRINGLKLSLYLRDESGQPLLPEDGWLPADFPRVGRLPPSNVDDEIARAVGRRPEPRQLQIELRRLHLDRRLAENQMLPRIDLVLEGSKDVGAPATIANDKGPFQLVVGATGEVPVQRRKARGKLRETTAKIVQVSEKLRLQQDKISVEVQSALASLELSAALVEQDEAAFRNALDTLDRYRFAFDRGKIDLIYLNLLETKANESEIKLIKAQQSWFDALAEYQAAAGLDPFDQAEFVTQLPPSQLRSRRGRNANQPDADSLDRDWQLRIGTPESE